MWSKLSSERRDLWGPFAVEPLGLRVRLLIWASLAALFLVDTALALGGTGVTRPEELLQLAVEYVLVGVTALHAPLGVLATALALGLGGAWWDHDAISLLFAGVAGVLGLCARLPLILLSAVLFVVWLLVDGLLLDRFGDVTASLLAFSALGGLGAGVGLRVLMRRLNSAIHLAEDRRVQLEQAQREERRRLALELHDVVGHGLTVISMQASMLSTLADPERRAAAERVIGDTARQSLGDLRTMLGVLRSTPSAEPSPPASEDVPPVDQVVETCASRLRAAGFTVDTDVRLTAEVPDSLLLTLHRLVQESTTNVLKHAASGGRVDISLDHSTTESDLRVSSTLPGHRLQEPLPHTGYGLAGMDERVRILGGTLTHGPEDGRWVLHAVIPSQRSASRR